MNGIIAIVNQNEDLDIANVVRDALKDSSGEIRLSSLQRKFTEKLKCNPIERIPEELIQTDADRIRTSNAFKSPLYHLQDGYVFIEHRIGRVISITPHSQELKLEHFYEDREPKKEYIN